MLVLVALLGAGCATASAGPGPSTCPDPGIAVPLPTGGWGRCIEFSGRSWQLRASPELEGAGPDRWSDRPESAWVDDQGRLHLRLRRRGGEWHAVELATPLDRGWPELTLRLGDLPTDPAVIVGAFFYRVDRSELDLELGRWGDPTAPNAQFVVVPPGPETLHRFELPAGSSEHRITWRQDAVGFTSRSGDVVTRWSRSGPVVPHVAGHRLHLNLWLHRGRTPDTPGPHELIVESLTLTSEPLFTPTETP